MIGGEILEKGMQIPPGAGWADFEGWGRGERRPGKAKAKRPVESILLKTQAENEGTSISGWKLLWLPWRQHGDIGRTLHYELGELDLDSFSAI